jgi:hypothetical protein
MHGADHREMIHRSIRGWGPMCNMYTEQAYELHACRLIRKLRMNKYDEPRAPWLAPARSGFHTVRH